MGYLASGAMVGVGKEWLKQGDEKRAANYQMIRDKRIAGLRRDNLEYGHNLDVKESKRSEGVASAAVEQQQGYLTTEAETLATATKTKDDADRKAEENKALVLNRGDIAINQKTGEEIGRGSPFTFAPNAASAELGKQVRRRGVGGNDGVMATYKELGEDWLIEWHIDVKVDDGFGGTRSIKQPKPNAPGLIEYYNSQTTSEYQLEPNDPRYMQYDPDRKWALMMETRPDIYNDPVKKQAVLTGMMAENGWWEGPKKYEPPVNPGTEGPNQGAAVNEEPSRPNIPGNEGPNADIEAEQAAKLPPVVEQSYNEKLETRKAEQDAENANLGAEEKRLYREAQKGSQAAARAYAAFKKKYNR